MYPRSIELLNQAIADELHAVHQYMYFHFHCDDQGYDLLASLFKRTAIEEMMHIEKLAERVLFLKGEIHMNAEGTIQKIHHMPEMLSCASEMEETSAKEYNHWANECGTHADAISRQLFESLVADEERHYDLFETELSHMKELGENYLALHSIERSKGLLKGQPG